MFGYGIAVGLVLGLPAGVFLGWGLIRYGMAMHERLENGFKDGLPVFTDSAVPLEYGATGESPDDMDVESDATERV